MALAITVPATLDMIVGEQLDLKVNFTNLIAGGDVISSPTATMTNAGARETVPSSIIGSPSVSSSVIMDITVSSANLRPGTDYVLTLSCVSTGGSQTKNVSALLSIKVIY